MIIRDATLSDAERLLEIYSYYVINTAVTFEYDVPSIEEFKTRISTFEKRYPYIVLEDDGKIQGFAYAHAFHERHAYDWSCETTIYISNDKHGKGYGKALYTYLEECIRKMGVQNMYACIACADKNDEYLTNASPIFHERMGFTLNGRFKKCGYKFGKWYDMIWMEKLIGDHSPITQPVVKYSEIL